MRNLSVTTFIHILFSIAIMILVVTIFLFLSWDRDSTRIKEIKHYTLIAETFLSTVELNPSEEKLKKLYKNFNVKPIPSDIAKPKIKEEGKTIFTGKSIYGQVRIFQTKENHYIYIQKLGYNLMLKDNRPKKYTLHKVISIGLIIISILLILYIAILRKLYPLKKLHKEIEKFANGDKDIDISYKNDDEIGKIAKSFNDAIKHINQLTASKNLFMRNIMHELKTPITKGRIVAQTLDEGQLQSILIRAFDRMNELINELAQVERISTRTFEPVFEDTTLSDIFEKSKLMLMIENSKISAQFTNFKLKTDSKLLSLAIKNLLDNAIKYGVDKQVIFIATRKSIEIISKGKPLTYTLDYYVEAFSQEEKRKNGFGLGLYIVNSILEKLDYKLNYKYKNENNIFEIIL